MIQDYWNPIWEMFFEQSDFDVQKVFDGLKIDCDGKGLTKPLEEAKEKSMKPSPQLKGLNPRRKLKCMMKKYFLTFLCEVTSLNRTLKR